VPDMADSPDRVDALVHGVTALNTKLGPAQVAVPTGLGPTSGRPTGEMFGYRPRDSRDKVHGESLTQPVLS
jgi:hypothetical protein